MTSRPATAWLGAAVISVVALLLAVPIVLRLAGHDLRAALLLQEDDLYESFGALCALAAAVIFGYLFFAYPQRTRLGPLELGRNLCFAAAAVLLVLVFGEEISWFQRVFEFDTPEWIAERNQAGEFNFHNLGAFQPEMGTNTLAFGWLVSMLAYLGLLPPLARRWPRLMALCEQAGLPIAGPAISGSLLLSAVVVAIGFVRAASEGDLSLAEEWIETFEAVAEFLVAALAVEVYLALRERLSTARRVGLTATLVVVLVPVVVGLLHARSQLSGDEPLKERSHIWYKRGSDHFADGELDDAQVAFQQAVDVWPANALAHYQLGVLAAQRGDWRSAVESLEQAVAANPSFAQGHHALGVALLQLGEQARAIEHFEAVVRLVPDSDEARQNLEAVRRGQPLPGAVEP